jgi:hypothetical protein
MHLLFFVGCFSILSLAQLSVTDPSQWPDWSNVRNCAQYAVETVPYDVGCGDWTCVCEHDSIAQATLLSAAVSLCSSNEQDIATATSILDWFCSQLPNSTPTLLPGVIVTDPSQWPGWSNVRNCAQFAVETVPYDVGCGDSVIDLGGPWAGLGGPSLGEPRHGGTAGTGIAGTAG